MEEEPHLSAQVHGSQTPLPQVCSLPLGWRDFTNIYSFIISFSQDVISLEVCAWSTEDRLEMQGRAGAGGGRRVVDLRRYMLLLPSNWAGVPTPDTGSGSFT